jgi:hypothetical protein
MNISAGLQSDTGACASTVTSLCSVCRGHAPWPVHSGLNIRNFDIRQGFLIGDQPSAPLAHRSHPCLEWDTNPVAALSVTDALQWIWRIRLSPLQVPIRHLSAGYSLSLCLSAAVPVLECRCPWCLSAAVPGLSAAVPVPECSCPWCLSAAVPGLSAAVPVPECSCPCA